jgi:hypothetical protein
MSLNSFYYLDILLILYPFSGMTECENVVKFCQQTFYPNLDQMLQVLKFRQAKICQWRVPLHCLRTTFLKYIIDNIRYYN